MEQFFKSSYVDKYTAVINTYYQEVEDAEKNIEFERQQALKLQTKFRAFKLSGHYREIRRVLFNHNIFRRQFSSKGFCEGSWLVFLFKEHWL